MIRQIEVAASFEEAAARLQGPDRKHVDAFVQKLVAAPDSWGVHFEMVRDAHDRHMLSARVSRDLRAVGYECGDVLTLLWADQHDKAYTWAAHRCVECHPVSGHVIKHYEVPSRAGGAS